MRNGSEKSVGRMAVLRKHLFPNGLPDIGGLTTEDTCGIVAYIGNSHYPNEIVVIKILNITSLS